MVVRQTLSLLLTPTQPPQWLQTPDMTMKFIQDFTERLQVKVILFSQRPHLLATELAVQVQEPQVLS
jgi:hypothetical protein